MTTTDARELDARVAEKVFGCWVSYIEGRPVCGCTLTESPAPHAVVGHYDLRRYTADVAADYEVLAHVRKTWSHGAQYQFAHALAELYRPRKEGNHPILRYMPGDYSRAALAVMEGE